MKKLLAVLLIIVLIVPSFSLADRHLFAHYSLYIDGEFYNSFFKAGFKFDTQLFDFYLYDDFSGGLFSKEEWYMGQRINYGLTDVKYSSSASGIVLTLSDGSVFNAYWDDNDEDLWIDLGGGTYFRFVPVHSFDIQKDMVKK